MGLMVEGLIFEKQSSKDYNILDKLVHLNFIVVWLCKQLLYDVQSVVSLYWLNIVHKYLDKNIILFEQKLNIDFFNL
jgi:hypothetical protein